MSSTALPRSLSCSSFAATSLSISSGTLFSRFRIFLILFPYNLKFGERLNCLYFCRTVTFRDSRFMFTPRLALCWMSQPPGRSSSTVVKSVIAFRFFFFSLESVVEKAMPLTYSRTCLPFRNCETMKCCFYDKFCFVKDRESGCVFILSSSSMANSFYLVKWYIAYRVEKLTTWCFLHLCFYFYIGLITRIPTCSTECQWSDGITL